MVRRKLKFPDGEAFAKSTPEAAETLKATLQTLIEKATQLWGLAMLGSRHACPSTNSAAEQRV